MWKRCCLLSVALYLLCLFCLVFVCSPAQRHPKEIGDRVFSAGPLVLCQLLLFALGGAVPCSRPI